MVKRRAAPNPEAMMIAVRFAGGRRVDGEEEGEDGEGDDGDEGVFMVFFFFFFFFSVCFFIFYLFIFSNFFERVICCFCCCCVSFLEWGKIGEEFLLFGWLVAVFSFFGDFGVFLLVLCYSYIHL